MDPTVKSSPALNFCFPIKEQMESDRVLLVPFDSSKHAETFWQESQKFPDLIQWVPFGPWSSVDEYRAYVKARFEDDPTLALWAVMTKPPTTNRSGRESYSSGEMAGIICLLNSSPSSSSTEIGAVFTFPRFQRTYVTTHAVGLLLIECLTPVAEGGLGLRRVQWQANAQNAASRRAAERMGFFLEGTIRWQRVLSAHKRGNFDLHDSTNNTEALLATPPKGWENELAGKMGPGRDSYMLSLCWDDWLLHGKREYVVEKMNRHY